MRKWACLPFLKNGRLVEKAGGERLLSDPTSKGVYVSICNNTQKHTRGIIMHTCMCNWWICAKAISLSTVAQTHNGTWILENWGPGAPRKQSSVTSTSQTNPQQITCENTSTTIYVTSELRHAKLNNACRGRFAYALRLAIARVRPGRGPSSPTQQPLRIYVYLLLHVIYCIYTRTVYDTHTHTRAYK